MESYFYGPQSKSRGRFDSSLPTLHVEQEDNRGTQYHAPLHRIRESLRRTTRRRCREIRGSQWQSLRGLSLGSYALTLSAHVK